MEHQVLFSRADVDGSQSVDLNELYIHLKSSHPVSLMRGPRVAAQASANLSSQGEHHQAASETALLSARHAAAQAEQQRQERIDALLERAAPVRATTARWFGDAETRALAALFGDLDHDRDGALSLAEFRVLLTLLAERAGRKDAAASGSVGGGANSDAGGGANGAGADAGVAFELRKAHAIFHSCSLNSKGSLEFADFLQLLAADSTISRPALSDADDSVSNGSFCAAAPRQAPNRRPRDGGALTSNPAARRRSKLLAKTKQPRAKPGNTPGAEKGIGRQVRMSRAQVV